MKKTIRGNEIQTANISKIVSVDLKRGREFLQAASVTLSFDSTYSKEYIQQVAKSSAFSSIFDIVYFLDSNGNVQWAERLFKRTNSSEALHYSSVTYRGKNVFIKARQIKSAVWSETYTSLITGERTVTILVPCGIGFVAADINMRRLLKTIGQLNFAKEMQFAILDRYGNFIYHPKANYLYKYSSIPELRGEWSDTIFSFEYEEESQDLLGSASRVDESGWVVVAYQPQKEAVEDVVAIGIMLLLLFVVMFLIAFITSIASSGKMKQLLQTVEDRAKAVGSGEYTHTASQVDVQEFEVLSQAIDSMANAVAQRENKLRDVQQYMEQQNTFQQKLIDSISNPVFVLADDQHVLLTNEACKRNLSEEYKDLSELSKESECSVFFSDEKEHQVLVQRSEIRLQNNREVSVVSVVDITERLGLESKLHHSEKLQAVGQLAGGIAHDVNNQLTGIMGFAEILKMSLPKACKEVEYVNAIIDAVEQSSGVTHQLLAFSRQGTYSLKPVSLNEMVHAVAGMLEHTISKKITLTVSEDQMNPSILADKSQIQNAILNLGINARDAIGDEAGTISLEVSNTRLTEPLHTQEQDIPEGLYAVVKVCDTGTGISDEIRKRIFEPFFTTKPEGKGTGMGLAAVLGTVTSHNGYVDIGSSPLGGACFFLYLPLLKDDDTGSELPKAMESVKKRNSLSILIIDDEPFIRLTTKELLKQQGHRCLCAENGKSGIELFKENRDIDIVLLDANMPVMSGYETFDELRKISGTIPVLMVTGYADESKVKTLTAHKGCDYIHKPFTIEGLILKIEKLVHGDAE